MHLKTGPVARLRELHYGPNPEDWRFVWDTYEDEWPGQFWEGVDARIEREEALKSMPPGAWVEEEEHVQEFPQWGHE
jgi:hypothetical protein